MKSFKQFLIEDPLEPSSSYQRECDVNGICRILKKYESGGNEEKILSVYNDNKGFPTIGHGHLVTENSAKIFAETFPEEHKKNPNFGSDILSGKSKMTPEQADKLLARDVSVRLPEVRRMVPNFDTYSPELQGELTSEHFRGMLGQSPKALKLINRGDLSGAANEYLNAKEYRESKLNKTGIAARMDNLANALRTEAARQNKGP
jgi:GH24 family phage-related lysozyme (muramidase)